MQGTVGIPGDFQYCSVDDADDQIIAQVRKNRLVEFLGLLEELGDILDQFRKRVCCDRKIEGTFCIRCLQCAYFIVPDQQ